MTFCAYIFAILLPPVAVLSKCGCGADFLINILLTLLAWLPGCIHAIYVINQRDKFRHGAYPYNAGPYNAPPPMAQYPRKQEQF